ncbi:hypothetical protein AB1Y20_000468 [Prymnesium parvum]|uniref:Pseudouridine synthase RsuA/RluA-like domain-containing protein n=1 Tax=Prymnesium parvum TaxID=97485 RepID=A0AB34K8D5_PRYPA
MRWRLRWDFAVSWLFPLSEGVDLRNHVRMTTYALHKPRGVLSSVSDPNPLRRTLTDVMREARVAPLPGHVGRLDAETSGLMLVTADSLLLRAVLGWEEVAQAYGARVVPKVYRLLLAGRHERDSEKIVMLREPLLHQRAGKEYHSDGALVRHLRCFRDVTLATECDFVDRNDIDNVARERALLRESRQPARSRATGELVPPYVPFDGWLTEVELTISQGRHRQIRRLCKRSGLELRHLRREAIGPVELGNLRPGEVRILPELEKLELYGACFPNGISRG